MLKIPKNTFLVFFAGAGFSLQAATVSYAATDAVSDPVYHGGGSDHALWIPMLMGNSGAERDWSFGAVPGLFQVFDDGSAQFSGSVENQSNNIYRGDLGFDFAPSNLGLPKLELNGSAYAPGGPVDPSIWDFFDTVSGSFSGTGVLDGLELSFTQRPTPSATDASFKGQLGDGANGKNADFGFSSWFYWEIVACIAASGNDGCAQLNLDLGQEHHGDININLSAVPLPAALWLFATAIFGLLGISRKSASDA